MSARDVALGEVHFQCLVPSKSAVAVQLREQAREGIPCVPQLGEGRGRDLAAYRPHFDVVHSTIEELVDEVDHGRVFGAAGVGPGYKYLDTNPRLALGAP